MTILITGASGFVGQKLCSRLADQNQAVRGVARRASEQVLGLGDMDATTDWSQVLPGCVQVVHLAARVHVMQDASASPLQEYRRVNVQGGLALARQAAAAGVKRFVFISSVKVNGEFSAPGRPFRADDVPAPQDPYGVSKMEAEAGLRALAGQTGMEVVIIRPPLVYGPGVKANFASMVRWLQRGVPLPLGAIHNRRSLVALDNLVDFITVCLHHPAAANQTFMVSDGEDVSTSDLLRRVGKALGKPARLLPIPPYLLKCGASLLGKQETAQRLISFLQVDSAEARHRLGWTPPITLEQGLLQVAQSIRHT